MTRLTDRQMSLKSLCVMSEVSLSVHCGVSICWRSLWKCVCLYIYMATTECGGKSWEWFRRWGCVIATEGKITSMMAPVTYVSVHPCMHAMWKYKRQKAFCCHVQQSVVMFYVFSAEMKVRLHVLHYWWSEPFFFSNPGASWSSL